MILEFHVFVYELMHNGLGILLMQLWHDMMTKKERGGGESE